MTTWPRGNSQLKQLIILPLAHSALFPNLPTERLPKSFNTRRHEVSGARDELNVTTLGAEGCADVCCAHLVKWLRTIYTLTDQGKIVATIGLKGKQFYEN